MVEHAPKVSIGTQNAYKAYLKNLLLFFGKRVLTEVAPKNVAEYKVIRYKAGVKPSTINREMAMLSKAFNIAIKDWGWLKENPISLVSKEKEENERDRWLSEDEKTRLITIALNGWEISSYSICRQA